MMRYHYTDRTRHPFRTRPVHASSAVMLEELWSRQELTPSRWARMWRRLASRLAVAGRPWGGV